MFKCVTVVVIMTRANEEVLSKIHRKFSTDRMPIILFHNYFSSSYQQFCTDIINVIVIEIACDLSSISVLIMADSR